MSSGVAHALACPLPSPTSLFSPCLCAFRPPANASLPTVRRIFPIVRAVSAPEECNEEECAPEKEVGKISMEWVAEEKTKVTGTFPPTKKKWTGYVEKDTAGQTNIYSIEPTVYISENAISSGTAGDSTEGSEQTIAISVGLFLGLILAAGIVLQNVGKGSPGASEAAYTGPSLSFYIQRFKPSTRVDAVPEVATPVDSSLSFSAPSLDTPEVSLEPSDEATRVADEASP